jgi:cytoskeletal protein RodZ
MSENWNLEIVADTKPEAPPEKAHDAAAPAIPSVLSGDHSLGKIMAMAREARGFTREQAAKASNIPGYYLTMIESDDYSSIADQLYLLPFLRRYAAFVALEPEEVASRFIREVQRADMNPGRSSEPIVMIADRKPFPWRLIMMVVGALIVAGAIGWFGYRHFMARRSAEPISAAPAPAEPVAPDAASLQGASPPDASSPDASPPGATKNAAPATIGDPVPAAASSSGASGASSTIAGATSNAAAGGNLAIPSSAATSAASNAAPAEKSFTHPAASAKSARSRHKLKAKSNQT